MSSSIVYLSLSTFILIGTTACGGAQYRPEIKAVSTIRPAVSQDDLDSGQKKYLSPFAGMIFSAKSGKSYQCPSPPDPYTDELAFPSKYEGSGKSRDTLNPLAEIRYKLATRRIGEFEAGIAESSDRYVSGIQDAAICTLDWMNNWATAGALLGEANMTGMAARKWALSAIAFNFLKIKEDKNLDKTKLEKVKSWITNLAAKVINEHNHIPPDKINNHLYWAAAAVGASGIAVQNGDFLEWAFKNYRIGANLIDDEGVLSREMARKTQALAYHNYALQPLVMLAEMGRVNGRNLYSENNYALSRLMLRVLEGIKDPGFFEARTGATQKIPEDIDGRALVWIEPLAHACPGDTQLQQLQKRYQPFTGRRVGGNLTDVYARINKEQGNANSNQACNHLWR